jgi:hypothetical protein
MCYTSKNIYTLEIPANKKPLAGLFDLPIPELVLD